MARQRKLTLIQVREAAKDRRSGTTWRDLSIKYKVAINTIYTIDKIRTGRTCHQNRKRNRYYQTSIKKAI